MRVSNRGAAPKSTGWGSVQIPRALAATNSQQGVTVLGIVDPSAEGCQPQRVRDSDVRFTYFERDSAAARLQHQSPVQLQAVHGCLCQPVDRKRSTPYFIHDQSDARRRE